MMWWNIIRKDADFHDETRGIRATDISPEAAEMLALLSQQLGSEEAAKRLRNANIIPEAEPIEQAMDTMRAPRWKPPMGAEEQGVDRLAHRRKQRNTQDVGGSRLRVLANLPPSKPTFQEEMFIQDDSPPPHDSKKFEHRPEWGSLEDPMGSRWSGRDKPTFQEWKDKEQNEDEGK